MTTNNPNYHPYGVYIDLPFEYYLQDPSLSQSGMKDLLVSPMNFWINSGLNPERKKNETSAMSLGTAVHTRILDGLHAYSEQYAVAPKKRDYPNAVDGAVALKTLCKEMGLKATGTIAELCKRIQEVDSHAELWPEIKRGFEETSENKQILKGDDGETVNRISEMVERHTTARDAFQNGVSEVTVFWPDSVTGIPMKARFDYLKPGIIVELKTFTNLCHIEVGKAVSMATARYGYHLQAIHYLEAAASAIQMIKKRMVYGSDNNDNSIIQDFAEQRKTRFFFVFVETSEACNLLVREYKNLNDAGGENLLYQSGSADLERAKDLFLKCKDKFGDSPWALEYPVEVFTDEMFPAWAIQ